MINLKAYATNLQNGLNTAFNNPNIQFTVWSDVGKYKRAKRKGNVVTSFINCILRREPGSIMTGNNGLIMATDSLRLEVAVPLMEPRQTVEAPAETIIEDTYAFVEKVRNVMDGYFSKNTIVGFTDEDGVSYMAGMEYSFSATGPVSLDPMIGQHIDFTVYISVNVVQNGINSRETRIEIDGRAIPFLTASPNRASVKSTDVYSDSPNGESDNIMISSAFVMDLSQPATSGVITSQFAKYLLHGRLNTAHFMKVTIGEESAYSVVTFGDISQSIEGVSNIGETMPLIRMRWNEDIMGFPKYMTVVRISVTGQTPVTVTVTPSADCIMHFGFITEGATARTLEIKPEWLEYDEANDEYYMYVAACPKGNSAVTLTITGAASTVIQQGGAIDA